MKKLRILMVGYLPPPTGGVRVLFSQLAQELEHTGEVELTVVNLTGAARGFLRRLASLVWAVTRAVFYGFRVDVVTLHPTNQALLFAGPLLYLVCRLTGKPLIVRKFGGSFHETLSDFPDMMRKILKATVFKADLWLFETHFLVNHFQTICRRVAYYPNNRPHTPQAASSNSSAKRFVFISHISSGKGVPDLFDISDLLPADCVIDIYGPLGFDIPPSRIEALGRRHAANYMGPIPPEKVSDTMRSYDVLLLPTRLRTEGYPGVILEAYASGLPVIASDCGAIGEIVDSRSGLLIEPGNQGQLLQQIMKIHSDHALFHRLRAGALEKAAQFDSSVWTAAFLGFCRELHEKRDD